MKLAILATLLCLACSTRGAAVDDSDVSKEVNFGDALKMFYQAYLKMLPCGYKDEFPVMAPLSVDFLSYDYSSEYYSLKGNFSNLLVTGLDKLALIDISFDPISKRTTFDMMYPQLQVVAEYMIDSWVNIAGYPVKHLGDGILNWKGIDMRYTGAFTLSPSLENPETLRITDFNLKSYTGNLIANNWNNLWDISINNFVNRYLPKAMLMFSEHFQERANELMNEYLIPLYNKQLETMTMKELVSKLTQGAQEFEAAATCKNSNS